MSTNYVVDANVLAKIILNENDSALAENFVQQVIEDENSYLLVPHLFFYELAGLLKKNRLAARAIYDFVSYYQSACYLKTINLSSELLQTSLQITTEGNKKSGYPTFDDAVYHALALLNNCPFITADKKHYAKTKHLGHIKLLGDIARGKPRGRDEGN